MAARDRLVGQMFWRHLGACVARPGIPINCKLHRRFFPYERETNGKKPLATPRFLPQKVDLAAIVRRHGRSEREDRRCRTGKFSQQREKPGTSSSARIVARVGTSMAHYSNCQFDMQVLICY
jgi:hypothetical protein